MSEHDSTPDIDAELNALMGRGQRQQLADELSPLLANGRGRLVITFEKSQPRFIEPDPEYHFLPNWDQQQFQAVEPLPRRADFEQLVPSHWRAALVQALQQVMGAGWGKLYILVDQHRIRAIYPVQSKRVVPGSRPLVDRSLQK